MYVRYKEASNIHSFQQRMMAMLDQALTGYIPYGYKVSLAFLLLVFLCTCMYCTAPLSPVRGALEVFMMMMMMMIARSLVLTAESSLYRRYVRVYTGHPLSGGLFLRCVQNI